MNSSDGIVSQMLMGFVERKISPQTIADVLRAQIFESQISVQLLDSATCNGILETLTLANSIDDCVDLVYYLSTHPDFPDNLSFKAAAGSLCVLLRYAQKKADNYKKNLEFNHQKLDYDNFQEQNFFELDIFNNDLELNENNFLEQTKKIDVLIESLADIILNIFYSNAHLIDYEAKETLSRILKNSNSVFTTLLAKKESFQKLRFIFLNSNPETFGTVIKGILPKPYDMLLTLQKTPDEQLLRNGVSYYKTEPAEKYSSGRLKYLKSVIETLKINSASNIKKTILIEWIFDNALNEAIQNENNAFEYITALKYIFEYFPYESCFIKGVIKSIQKDYTSFHTPTLAGVTAAESLTNVVFTHLVTLAEKDLNYVSKNVANWALEIPLQNEHFRFFKKSHWRWIRSLSAKIWDASLREPPAWIVETGSLYCAPIFQIAPALWLQDYSVILIERVYHETLVERFLPTPEHFNYVEYLIRCIRKKSPFFASRTESLFALSLLSRLTRSEALQYTTTKTRFQNLLPSYSPAQIQISPEFLMWKQILDDEENFTNKLGNNPVTRAIAILMQLSLETAKFIS